jgi:dTDP-4-dehydrorhamnose reductase
MVDAVPNPLNAYGQHKYEGEVLTLKESPRAAVLRVPLLYGPFEYPKESSVTQLFQDLQNGLKKADHLQKRYPTFTCDVAKVLKGMIDAHVRGDYLTGIFHWQGTECLTKHDMVSIIAELTNLDASGVAADTVVPPAPRPEDSRLDCSRLEAMLAVDKQRFRTPFREALGACLEEAKKQGIVLYEAAAVTLTPCLEREISVQELARNLEQLGFDEDKKMDMMKTLSLKSDSINTQDYISFISEQ